MINVVAPEKRIFRAAFLPVFACYLANVLATAFLMLLAAPPLAPSVYVFLLVMCIVTATAATVILQQFCFEVLSADGVEIHSPLGDRLFSWKDVAAIYTFRSLKLVYLRFNPGSGRSKRILLFQRRAGEFRGMVADLVPKESLVWKRLNDI